MQYRWYVWRGKVGLGHWEQVVAERVNPSTGRVVGWPAATEVYQGA